MLFQIPGRGWGWGTPCYDLYGEAPPQRGTFFLSLPLLNFVIVPDDNRKPAIEQSLGVKLANCKIRIGLDFLNMDWLRFGNMNS